jgi:D-sedoheptulose 7-phosphate isomerase
MSVQTIAEEAPLQFARDYKEKLAGTLESVDLDRVGRAIGILEEARRANRHIFVCGNGGSASTASHFVTDMVKGASFQRESRFRIMALTDSPATITAYSNDVGYDCVFAEQLKNFAGPGDVFIAISGSGNSLNVINAMECANTAGCKTIALTGRDGGKLGSMAQVEIRVRESHMGRIEDGHLIVCHMMCYYFMQQ